MKKILSLFLVCLFLTARMPLSANASGIVSKSVEWYEYGDKGSIVRKINKYLKKLGYIDTVTSTFTSKTASAVDAFQEAHGLNRTEIVDKETYILLKNTRSAITYRNYAKNKGWPMKGDNGTAVTEVQLKLKYLNLYKGKLDGKFSASLEKAVKKCAKGLGVYSMGAYTQEMDDLLMDFYLPNNFTATRGGEIITAIIDTAYSKYFGRKKLSPGAAGLRKLFASQSIVIPKTPEKILNAQNGKVISQYKNAKRGDILIFSGKSIKYCYCALYIGENEMLIVNPRTKILEERSILHPRDGAPGLSELTGIVRFMKTNWLCVKDGG